MIVLSHRRTYAKVLKNYYFIPPYVYVSKIEINPSGGYDEGLNWL